MDLHARSTRSVNGLLDVRHRSRAVVALTSNILALCTYAGGLLSPLTPSEGVPSVAMLLLFAGGPISLLLASSRLYQSFPARALCYCQVAIVGSFSVYLLLLQAGVFPV
jgi:hypothetical protein